MQPLTITRKLFVSLLANNNHGKTGLIRALVNQGRRERLERIRRGPHLLTTPWGRALDALVIPRSYQETLAGEFHSVIGALDGVDPQWRTRDLIIFPSHLAPEDCREMIAAANGGGFDTIAVSVILTEEEVALHSDCMSLAWNQRLSLLNSRTADPDPQIEALGNDLWTRIANAARQP